jgi:hypothetical protein
MQFETFYDATWQRYPGDTVIYTRHLKHRLIVQRGCWCDQECRAPEYQRPRWHTPHVKDWQLGYGFDAAFSRALRTLVERGALVPVARQWHPGIYALDWHSDQRLYVVQAPGKIPIEFNAYRVPDIR